MALARKQVGDVWGELQCSKAEAVEAEVLGGGAG